MLAPKDTRHSSAVPLLGEAEEERKSRDEVLLAVLEAGGYRV
ncbi:MAG TPA: hypothetical protein VKY65_03090 [Alphaproteobacteria bacterium]|nr:hypothetical protein [Alphaproteobacteria bacterium]